MAKKESVYTDFEAEKFLSNYISVSPNQLVNSIEQIKIKPPLALKIISKQALHKTEIGGVKIVNHHSTLEPAFDQLLEIAKKHKIKLDGIMAQKFQKGEQLIVGIKKDPVFGHMILFGIGGIFTELLKDTATRKCPITTIDAKEMIDELRASQLFYGFRGEKLNTKKLIDTLVKISHLPIKHKKIEELDINPLILNAKDAIAVDARIVWEN